MLIRKSIVKTVSAKTPLEQYPFFMQNQMVDLSLLKAGVAAEGAAAVLAHPVVTTTKIMRG